MKTIFHLSCFYALSLLTLSSGCATTSNERLPQTYPVVRQTVIFDNLKTLPPLMAPEPDNIRMITLFALTLSSQGNHLEAAEILREQAENLQSQRNEMNIALHFAAAREYLLADRLTDSRAQAQMGWEKADRFQRAALDSETQRLLKFLNI